MLMVMRAPRPVVKVKTRRSQPAGFIGQGAEMITLRASLERLATAPHLDVLIKGERGAGRRTVARALHDATPNAGDFIELDNAPHLDAALASRAPCTLYLGELLRLSSTQQTKLYRALSQRRLDGRTRFVGALCDVDTPRTRGNELCHCLIDRFAVTLRIPPLRERGADLPALIDVILTRHARELNLQCTRLEPEALQALRQYPFPGNVRELENILRTALVACQGGAIRGMQLPIGPASQTTAFQLPSEGVNLDALERDVIRQALQRAQGNRTRAASLLGLTRDQVRYRLSKLGDGNLAAEGEPVN